MNKVKKSKLRLVISIAIVAFIIIPLSFAIYKKSSGSNGEITLATWSVSMTDSGGDNHLSVTPDPNGVTADYVINVTSQSQVDIVYSVVVDNLPSGVSVAIDGGSFETAVNNKVTFSNYGSILYTAANKTNTHTITFKAASNATLVSNQEVSIIVLTKQAI